VFCASVAIISSIPTFDNLGSRYTANKVAHFLASIVDRHMSLPLSKEREKRVWLLPLPAVLARANPSR
jgi:hypothetical protein